MNWGLLAAVVSEELVEAELTAVGSRAGGTSAMGAPSQEEATAEYPAAANSEQQVLAAAAAASGQEALDSAAWVATAMAVMVVVRTGLTEAAGWAEVGQEAAAVREARDWAVAAAMVAVDWAAAVEMAAADLAAAAAMAAADSAEAVMAAVDWAVAVDLAAVDWAVAAAAADWAAAGAPGMRAGRRQCRWRCSRARSS